MCQLVNCFEHFPCHFFIATAVIDYTTQRPCWCCCFLLLVVVIIVAVVIPVVVTVCSAIVLFNAVVLLFLDNV